MGEIGAYKYQVTVFITAEVVAHMTGAAAGKNTNQFILRMIMVLPGILFCHRFLVQQAE
jgi:hypothetical protein